MTLGDLSMHGINPDLNMTGKSNDKKNNNTMTVRAKSVETKRK